MSHVKAQVQQCFDVTRAEKGIGLVTIGTLRFNIFFEEASHTKCT